MVICIVYISQISQIFITEIAKDIENCKMWDFKWTDKQVLMIIKSLNSCDENEAWLAE